MTQLVSVIIPVRNGASYLAEAIDSVLAQSWPHRELVVVDDGSSDETPRIMASYGTQLRGITQKPSGGPAARNTGIMATQGEWLAFLDADDIWTPHKLERQLALMAASPGCAIGFGLMRQFHSPELAEERKARIKGHGDILVGYSSGTLLIRREDFMKVGLFDNSRVAGDFIQWYARAKDAGLTIALLEEVILLRRLHSANLGLTNTGRSRDYALVLKEALDRRRKPGT